MLIGIIDSGYGGLGFLKGIRDNNSYILIMDKAYFPYGIKSKEFLIKRTLYLCNYLDSLGVDRIILACNTLSIIALDFIKLYYDNVMGVLDLLDEHYNNSVFIGSSNAIKYINIKYPDIDIYDGQDIINRIEKNQFNAEDILLFNKLSIRYDYVILGCTHFINVKDKLLGDNYISQDELYKLKFK